MTLHAEPIQLKVTKVSKIVSQVMNFHERSWQHYDSNFVSATGGTSANGELFLLVFGNQLLAVFVLLHLI